MKVLDLALGLGMLGWLGVWIKVYDLLHLCANAVVMEGKLLAVRHALIRAIDGVIECVDFSGRINLVHLFLKVRLEGGERVVR